MPCPRSGSSASKKMFANRVGWQRWEGATETKLAFTLTVIFLKALWRRWDCVAWRSSTFFARHR
eukprot:6800382-Prymnesium_polylepis.3